MTPHPHPSSTQPDPHHPPAGGPPNPWGAPPAGSGWNPPAGTGSPPGPPPGPAPGWGPAPQAAGMPPLERDALTWLLVGTIGFFLGFMWITGPLAWWQANKLCARYAEQGMEPSGMAVAAKWIGVVTTVLAVATILLVVGALFFVLVLGVGLALW